MGFKKAVKYQAKLRLGLCGLAGTGKTFSALKIATAISKLLRENKLGDGRIAVIDSERGSASKYANRFDFEVSEIEDTYSPMVYVDKIHEAEREGFDIIIADSISHAWAATGGALDQKDQAAARGGNQWTAWRDVTPKHNALVNAMLSCKAHFMATMRQKMDYVQETEGGKTVIKKVGLAPVQREGMDYEFDLVGDIDYTHTLKITKTRFDGVIDIGNIFEKPGDELARKLFDWLLDGAPPELAKTSALALDAPRQDIPPRAPSEMLASELAVNLDEIADQAFRSYLEGMRAATSEAALNKAATDRTKPAPGTENYKIAQDEFRRLRKILRDQPQAAAS